MPMSSRRPFSFLTLLLLLAIAPAPVRAFNAATADPACAHPCARVAECPKVTCECGEASASGVAACDTERTHCCVSAEVACERFCEVNNQTWTGRFTPEPAAPDAATREQRPLPAAGDAGAQAPSAACAEPCQKAEDCRTMTCKCARGTVPDVAACDPSHCCGNARAVCEHFCKGKKGTWSGKTVDQPAAVPRLLDPPGGARLDGAGGGADDSRH